MNTHAFTTSGNVATEQLRDFFDRLAAGDYHNLARELCISGKPVSRPATTLIKDLDRNVGSGGSGDTQDPDASIQSIDSIDSFKFEPTAEGLHRAVSLIRGGEERQGAPTPEEDEAFQFTFRLMIHKLYSIKDFAKMVDDVVRSSREHFQPLEPAMVSRGNGRRTSVSFSFASNPDMYGEGDSFTVLGSPTSPSEASSILPSSDSSWTLDRMSNPPFEDESDARAVKKRIVGRKLSVVDGSMDDEDSRGPAWVYDSAVASVDASMPSFESPFSPGSDSPSGYDHPGTVDGMGYGSRKRRFSFLAARAL